MQHPGSRDEKGYAWPRRGSRLDRRALRFLQIKSDEELVYYCYCVSAFLISSAVSFMELSSLRAASSGGDSWNSSRALKNLSSMSPL